jgi:plastocyanin
MRSRVFALPLARLALAPATLAACGDDESENGGGETTSAGNGSIEITADPDGALAYEQSEVTAPAGELEIAFDNQASIDHDVVVEDADGSELARTDVISQDTATATAELAPGSYTFFCSVDAHRDAGMEGTLNVE